LPPNFRTVSSLLLRTASDHESGSDLVRELSEILVTADSPVGEKISGEALALAKNPPKRYERPIRCVRPSGWSSTP